MGDIASNLVVSFCSPDLEDLLRGRSYYSDHSADNCIRTIPKESEIKSMNSECKRVANGALKMLSKHPECHTIICGHTHQRPVHVAVNDSGRRLHYYNTGKFSKDLCMNILVEQDSKGTWSLVENY
jgi:UDP-2,3-diacylglucosamine pyrophosphatase LpxH